MRKAARESTQGSYHERILRVLDHIHAHLDEELTLPGLARVACFSPFHFHHVFRGMVGEGLAAYIRRLRLERSWRRLAETGDPVTTIGLAAGYGSHEAFDRAFKAHFGLTPTDARNAASITARLAPEDGRLPEALAARLKQLLAGEELPPPLGVEIRRIDPIPVAAMRQTGPYSEIPALFGRLLSWAGRNGLLGPGARVLGLCHDDPEMTPPEECRYDAGIALAPGKTPPAGDGVREILIQGGEYAVAIHGGRHCDLPETYSLICGRWCPLAGREIRDVPAIENYRNDARTTAPEDLRTEIYVPLEEEAC